jgi:hypothetical protein
MTNYRKTMRESLQEVLSPIVEDNMDLLRKAAKGAAQKLKMKDGMITMDSFTASALVQIFDKVNPANKSKMEKMVNQGTRSGLLKLQSFAMSKVNAEYVPEELDLDEASKEGTIKIIKTKDGKFQIQKMTKGKFVDIGKPHNSAKEAEKFRSGQPDMFGEQLAKIKGKTPGDKGRKAAVEDDIERAEKKGDKKEVEKLKEADLDEATKLPPHLAKFFDDKGNLKPEVAARVAKGKEKVNWKDVTPKGYGPKEEVDLDEGKMSQLHQHIKDKKSAEEIAKLMKVDVKTIKTLMSEVEADLDEYVGGSASRAVVGATATGAAAKKVVSGIGKKLGIGMKNKIAKQDKKLSKKQDKQTYKDNKAKLAGKNEDNMEEGAYSDARRSMSKDKDLSRVKNDTADDDTYFDPRKHKAASTNIIAQLRKVINLKGMGTYKPTPSEIKKGLSNPKTHGSRWVEFNDGLEQVDINVAKQVQLKYMKMSRPADKETFQKKISTSYRDMLKALREDYSNNSILSMIDKKLMERKND